MADASTRSPFHRISLLPALAAALIALAGAAQAEEPLWEPPYVGSDPGVLYLPDTNAVYWRYGWDRAAGDPTGIVIRGTIPDARYFSYNVYNDDTKNSLGSVPDFGMKLENGAANPYTGIETAARGSYALYILPEGSAFDAPNVLTFPASLTNVSVMLRHYLPVPDGDILGGAPMPKIARFDPETGIESGAPESNEVPAISPAEARKYLAPLLKDAAADPAATGQKIEEMRREGDLDLKQIIVRQVVAPAFGIDDPSTAIIESYRLGVSGNYPTNDNFYLAMPVVRKDSEVLVARFRAPGVVRKREDYPTADVRYYSVSQGDENSFTVQTLYDRDLGIAHDGFVYLMIGDDKPALRTRADALGMNFMPWRVGEKMLLVYRNMLPRPGYMSGANRVPFYDHSKPAPEQTGRAFIGDYAPIGILIDEQAILSAANLPGFVD